VQTIAAVSDCTSRRRSIRIIVHLAIQKADEERARPHQARRTYAAPSIKSNAPMRFFLLTRIPCEGVRVFSLREDGGERER
jgi:hypothetical protein